MNENIEKMLKLEETQRKRRTEVNNENNGAFEKKQRVEQLVTALARPTKKTLSSGSSSFDSVDFESNDTGEDPENDINIDVVSTDDLSPSPVTTTLGTVLTTQTTQSISVRNAMPIFIPSNKPVAKVVHFSPKIIQVESIAHKTRSAKSSIKQKIGPFAPPVPVQTSTFDTMHLKSAPKTMTRVPRDQNVPLIVYNPPRPKPMPTPVLPVLPMTSGGGLIIQAPGAIFSPGTLVPQPPTLIPASQLKKFVKHHQHHHHQQPAFATFVPVAKTLLAAVNTPRISKTNKPTKKQSLPPAPGMTLPLAPAQMTLKPVQQQQTKPQTTVMVKREQMLPSDSIMVTSDNKLQKEKNFHKWTVNEVHDHFLKSDCAEHAEFLREQEIDGKALSHLDEMNIPKLLAVKMGPAIKMAAIIRYLKNNNNS